MQPKLKELILASFSFEEHSPLYIKILMLNAVLFITVVISFTFLVVNTFVVHNYLLASIDVVILLSMLYALYLLRHRNEHQRAGYISTAIIFLLFLLIVMTQHGEKFTFIWTYFFAPFAMITLNARRGLIISLIFLSLLFSISCTGIGEWQQGQWDTASYFRFILAHFVILYVMYAIFHANEKANMKIEELRQNEKEQLRLFEKLSLTDPLTGLYNRRFLKEIFPKQFYSARRNGKTLAFFLLDIDFFKSFNDMHGHQLGDDLLMKVGHILKEELRRGEDYTFRIGGDEFAGILVSEDREGIEKKIRKVHQKISQYHIENDQIPDAPSVTVSIGIHIPTEEEYDFKEIYNITDTALYKAKADGRNRIVFL
jgi:diguanylate cyclase (GGDEF)-like protein